MPTVPCGVSYGHGDSECGLGGGLIPAWEAAAGVDSFELCGRGGEERGGGEEERRRGGEEEKEREGEERLVYSITLLTVYL